VRASQIIIKCRTTIGFVVLPHHLLVVLDVIITGNCHRQTDLPSRNLAT
jgi:hypothetical protein